MTPRELHVRIRSLCLKLLATVAMHPVAISVEVQAPVADVNEALHYDWQAFRQVAGTECFLWTVATNTIAIAAQREVVASYSPTDYSLMRRDSELPKGATSTSPAIIRALKAHGPGSIAELASLTGCSAATIQQQAARFSDYLDVTKELVEIGNRGRRWWRITRIALKQPIGGVA